MNRIRYSQAGEVSITWMSSVGEWINKRLFRGTIRVINDDKWERRWDRLDGEHTARSSKRLSIRREGLFVWHCSDIVIKSRSESESWRIDWSHVITRQIFLPTSAKCDVVPLTFSSWRSVIVRSDCEEDITNSWSMIDGDKEEISLIITASHKFLPWTLITIAFTTYLKSASSAHVILINHSQSCFPFATLPSESNSNTHYH